MLDRRLFLGAAVLGAMSLGRAPRGMARAEAFTAAQLNEFGPEARMIGKRVGLWDVTETAWDGPDAAPVTTTGLVAERRMLGALLQEIIRPATDTAHALVARTDLLTYDRLTAQWQYVSFDARGPDGLMLAASDNRGDGVSIAFSFQPFASPGPGPIVTGQLLRLRQVITVRGADRDVKQQYFTPADGTGREWLGHQYDYRRRV
ncbi:hypothetical protein [Lichenicola sp.]|uniref:hypothetical protein n=1 Tax=Lichenicola sp. TaxID=2804529 RepID=UPI003AFF9EA1